VSVALELMGFVLVAVGAAAVVLGAWSAIQERRPPWLSARSIPIGRERAWGMALATIGLGAVAFGLAESASLGVLGIVGIALIFGGVGMLVVAVRPTSSR
jgi:hypothetical protein